MTDAHRQLCTTRNWHSKVRGNSLIHMMIPGDPHYSIKEICIARTNGVRPSWTSPYGPLHTLMCSICSMWSGSSIQTGNEEAILDLPFHQKSGMKSESYS
jgi:hypothetical protein